MTFRSMRSILGAVALATAALLPLAGCATDSSGNSGAASAPRYAQAGPYEVGVATLKLADRSVEVYYPAKKGSAQGKPRVTYLQTDPLPPPMLAALPKIPAGIDLSVTIPAARDLPAAADGPFPLVIFSHGAGGYRMMYGNVLAGLASWGFVVASTDYVEYGFVSQFTGGGGDIAKRRAKVSSALGATIDLMAAENAKADGRFKGVINMSKIGAVGHSAGGGTMFGTLDDPRIGVIVGWAPVPPQTPVTSHTPSMIIAGEKDNAIPSAATTAAYDSLQAPKRFVLVGNLGHNAFSDICLPIRNGTDLVGTAKQLGLPVPDRLIALARNGCQPEDLDTQKGWTIIQHFTVAELRTGLGVDKKPVGLGPDAAKAFPGVTIDYREQLKAQ